MTVDPASRGRALRLRTCVVLWLLMLAVVGCGPTEPAAPVNVSGTVGDTAWSVVAMGPPADLSAQALSETVRSVLADVDEQVSGADAALRRFNRAGAGHWVDVPATFAALVQQAVAAGRETVGAYDVTRASLLQFWGLLDAARVAPASAESLQLARERTGIGLVDVRSEPPALRKMIAGVGLYLGDLLSAYRARLLAGRLQALGVTGWRIRFGDVLLVHGKPDSDKIFTAMVPTADGATPVSLGRQGAMATAIAPLQLELGGRRFASVIDPRTGRPITHSVRAVTALAADAVRASALAQALLVMGPQAGRAFANAHGIAARFVLRESKAQSKPLYSYEFRHRIQSAAASARGESK